MKTLSPEMDLWLEDQRAFSACRVPRRGPPLLVGVTDRDLSHLPPCPLTEAEVDWLWPRFQRCGFPPATFAKRFARTERDRLTARGKNLLVRLAYHYRRQIFGKPAVKWGEGDFLRAVRLRAPQRQKEGS